jgi:acyl-CoA thioesterase II
MGDLSVDTAVEARSDGVWAAVLSEDWNVWGPNGGYVASVCLRAAGVALGIARPATIACHYLSVAACGEVDLHVEILRASSRTAAAHVQMSQSGKLVADATVWGAADDLPGYEWSDVVRPDVDGPEAVTPVDPAASPFAMARNLDQRRLPPDENQIRHSARAWMRYQPTPTFDDPWADACRSLILLDTWAWASAASGLLDHERGQFLGPNLDVTARFFSNASDSDWLLVDAISPVATSGLIGSELRVWSSKGWLVAAGGAQLICRPRSDNRP